MPFHSAWEKHGVYIHYTGQTSDLEVAKVAETVEADHRFAHVRYVIHDFLECVSVTHSPQVIEEVAAIDGAASLTNPRTIIAVVHDREDVSAMVKAYLRAELSKFTLREFASLVLARRWLQRYLP
jgi:hypothetical protein